MKQHFVRNVVYIALTSLSLLLLYHFLDFKTIIKSISDIHWSWLVFAFALGFIYAIVQVFRLKLLLNLVTDISFFPILSMSYISALFSIILTYSGGFALAYYIAKKTKSSYSLIFTIFLIEFVLAQIPMVILGGVGLVYFTQEKLFIVESGNIVKFFVLSFFLLLLGLGFFYLIIKIKRNFIKTRLRKIKEGYHFLARKKFALFSVILLTLLMIMIASVQTYLYFIAFNLHPPFFDLLLAVNVFGILRLIPGIPTKLGQDEALGILTLPYLLNLDTNAVFALLLVTHIISLVIAIVMGFIFLYFLKADVYLLKAIRNTIKKENF